MGELSRRLSARELVEWMAFYEVDALLQEQVNAGKAPHAALEYTAALEDLRKD